MALSSNFQNSLLEASYQLHLSCMYEALRSFISLQNNANYLIYSQYQMLIGNKWQDLNIP